MHLLSQKACVGWFFFVLFFCLCVDDLVCQASHELKKPLGLEVKRLQDHKSSCLNLTGSMCIKDNY